MAAPFKAAAVIRVDTPRLSAALRPGCAGLPAAAEQERHQEARDEPADVRHVGDAADVGVRSWRWCRRR